VVLNVNSLKDKDLAWTSNSAEALKHLRVVDRLCTPLEVVRFTP